MGFVIGMDEAGYAPNLGPLVLTATVWEVPGSPKKTDFWSTFADIAASEVTEECGRLHVGDSKAVYSTSIGLGPLERSTLAALGVASRLPSGLHDLLGQLTGSAAIDGGALPRGDHARELWFADTDLDLPLTDEGKSAAEAAHRWRAICESSGVRLVAIQCDVVPPRRWNRATRETDNKATVLSRLSLQLLRRVWNPDDPTPTIVFADKHGGRNRYGSLLDECLDGQMVWCQGESRDESIYRVGQTEIRFEPRSERHFPVALASMVSKYVRELVMELFNRFWRFHLPELKPTRGYPLDARRFREEVAEVQARLAIPDEMFWRER